MYKALLLTTSLAFSIAASAQQITPEVVASSGNYHENSSASLSWTLGEPVIATHDNGGAILTQGFHQTILIIDAVENEQGLDIEIAVYPNPSTQLLTLERSDVSNGTLNIEVFDLLGKQVQTATWEATTAKMQLDVEVLTEGVYLLRITDEQTGQSNTFKIQKA